MAKRKGPPTVLKSWTEKVEGLGKFVDTAKPKIVRALEKVIAAQIARGEDPTGKPWKKTKAGKAPLVRAARAVKISAFGKVITVAITGHHARHHLGAIRGKVRRRILPSSKLPSPYAEAVRRVLVAEFKKTMGVT
jgi:hypothetical protein